MSRIKKEKQRNLFELGNVHAQIEREILQVLVDLVMMVYLIFLKQIQEGIPRKIGSRNRNLNVSLQVKVAYLLSELKYPNLQA